MTTILPISQTNVQYPEREQMRQDIYLEDIDENMQQQLPSQLPIRIETLNTQNEYSNGNLKKESLIDNPSHKNALQLRRRKSTKLDTFNPTQVLPTLKESSQKIKHSNESPKADEENNHKSFKSSPNLIKLGQKEAFKMVNNINLNGDQEQNILDLQKEQQIVSIEEQRICRLCLDSECNQETGQLQNVCNCNGSLKYIHKECLWLQIKNKISKMTDITFPIEISCELCKSEYRIEFKEITKMNSFKSFKENITKQIRPYITFFLFAFFSVIISGVLFSKISDNQKADYYVLIIYFFFSFALTSTIISLIFLFYFLFYSIFHKIITIQKIFLDINSYQQYKQNVIEKLNKQKKSIIYPYVNKNSQQQDQEIQLPQLI